MPRRFPRTTGRVSPALIIACLAPVVLVLIGIKVRGAPLVCPDIMSGVVTSCDQHL